ncbi:MAG: hypothetical protein QM736_12630 [Vicinamibacterales bacterium]
MLRQQIQGLLLVLAACAALVVALADGLRPDTFFVGDPGVKLVSTRNALRSPLHPLDIPLPTIGNETVPHVEQFFAVHGDHAHAVTSEFFPLVSAPLLAVWGLRGLYVLPALGFLAVLAGSAWFGWVLDSRRHMAIVAALAAIGTPFLFYGLEFWEHMPALGLVVIGTALLLDAARRRPGRPSDTLPTFVAGLLFGIATTLRAEAACTVFALGLASRMLVHRPAWRSLAVAAAGMAIGLLPLELYSVVHFGSWIPGHVGTNAALVGNDWFGERLAFAREWLTPSLWTLRGPVRSSSFWSVSTVAIIRGAGTVPHFGTRRASVPLDARAVDRRAHADGRSQRRRWSVGAALSAAGLRPVDASRRRHAAGTSAACLGIDRRDRRDCGKPVGPAHRVPHAPRRQNHLRTSGRCRRAPEQSGTSSRDRRLVGRPAGGRSTRISQRAVRVGRDRRARDRAEAERPCRSERNRDQES